MKNSSSNELAALAGQTDDGQTCEQTVRRPTSAAAYKQRNAIIIHHGAEMYSGL